MFELIKRIIRHDNTLTVYFYPEMNQSPILRKYKAGESIIPPHITAKEGFEIEGWYGRKKLTNKGHVNIRGRLLKSIRLYAKWKRVGE